jgi:hypothetical protein
MTAIATVITNRCTAHASDSFLTSVMPDGSLRVVEARRTKILRVEAHRGAMAYWGLATLGSLSILELLRREAAQAYRFKESEEFAKHLTDLLQKKMAKRCRDVGMGIGIHFTAYEWIGGHQIPELFQIKNFSDTSYRDLRKDGFELTRETYHAIMSVPKLPEHREPKYRLEVHRRLHASSRAILLYNNGDPTLFNPAARGAFAMIGELERRGQLVDWSVPVGHRRVAAAPIKAVVEIQRALAVKAARLVGGIIHTLSITPSGQYESDSGD